MESNQKNMFTPSRFIAFLVLLAGGIVAFFSGKDSQSDVYVPSDTIVQATESGEDALGVCKDGRDSFYVMLSKFQNEEFSSNLISKEKALDYLDSKIESINYFNLAIDYYSLKYDQLDSLDSANSIIKEEFENVFLKYSISKYNYKKFIEFCIKNRFRTNINLDLIYGKTSNQIPHDSLYDLNQLRLNMAVHLQTKMLFAKSLLEAENAYNYFKTDSLRYSEEYSQVLGLIANLHYDMEEYSLSYPFYKRAIRHTKKNCNNEEELEDIMYNSCVMIVNHYSEIDSLDSVQQIIFVESALNEYKDNFKTNHADIRLNFLNGIWYFNRYEDSLSNKYYSIARDLSNSQDIDVPDWMWLDVHVQNISPLKYLGKYEEALEIINDIRVKFPKIDSLSVFNNLVLAQAKMKELDLQTQLAINSSSTQKLELALNNVSNFIAKLEVNNLRINPDNIYYVNNNFTLVFQLKFKLRNALLIQNPSKENKARMFFEIDRLKSKEQFYKKIARNESDYDRLLYLIKRELETKGTDKYQFILDSLNTEYSEYYSLNYNQPIDYVEKLKKYCVENNTDIVEYYADGVNLAFIVTSEGLDVFPVDVDYDLIESFQKVLHKDSVNAYHLLNDKIYESIYKPIESKLNANKLTIISDGFVDNISFESFLIDNKYLVESKIISYSYSAKSLLVDSKQKSKNFKMKNLIAFSYTDTETYKKSKKGKFSELLYGFEECLSLKEMFPQQVDILAGFNATKNNFLKNAFDYDIIHLALHGAGKGTSIKSNKLYFRSKNGTETLEANEFQNKFNSNTNLIVLSACQTNFAKDIVNEGNLSIAKYFSNIGIENIITSTYNINDNSTSELMNSFYKDYSKSNNIAQALSKAKVQYYKLNEGELRCHPFYWSSLKYYKS